MKGYFTAYCYMGWIPSLNRYLAFATPSEYKEFYHAYEGR